LENGFNDIKKNDIIIIISLVIVLLMSIFIDYLMNKEKREITSKIKKHFKENKIYIDIKR
jgi:hypothetical protein